MSVSIATEKRALTKDEFALVEKSHYPEIDKLSADELMDTAKRIRELRNKSRDLARQQRREQRGKAEPRGAQPAKDNSSQTFKKQIFAAALKRINRRLTRLQAEDKRQAHIEAAQRALAAKKENKQLSPFVPQPGHLRKSKGMRSIPNNKRQELASGAEKGRVSQFMKNSQARRDNR
ncbi:MAG: hypothetical protein ACK4VI_08920 [Alphaproteobacteria bacterium]